MPATRNALVRYRVIDQCLQNRYRKWKLEDLMQACSDALYEYEGIDKEISRRTIQMDLQMMRSDKLGYNAPIVVREKKYYTYEDPDYSITNNPLSGQDLKRLTEAIDILKQFKGFSHFQELSGMVQRLEDKVDAAKNKRETVIDFEKNDHLKGLEFVDVLYKAIISKNALALTYQSFKARNASTFIFHPYLLKEYRNRWFVLGTQKKNQPLLNLALDRIMDVKSAETKYIPCPENDITQYFKDVVGVSVNHGGNTEKIVLFFDFATAPYVLTKPIHHSQKLIETQSHGMVISLNVQINFELEREILGFGDRVQVLAPEKLKRKIKDTFTHAIDLYNSDLDPAGIKNILNKVEHKGSAILQNIFTIREINKIKHLIQKHLEKKAKPVTEMYAIRQLLVELPELIPLVMNRNLRKIISSTGEKLFLSKSFFFDKPPQSNWYVTWHQDTTINVKKKTEAQGFFGWTKKAGVIGVCPPEELLKKTLTLRIHLDDTDDKNGALKIIPGSHNKRLKDEEISLISQNSLPNVCEVNAGGIHLMKPLLLHASSRCVNQRHRRVIHLEFNSLDLPNGLEWAEKQEV